MNNLIFDINIIYTETNIFAILIVLFILKKTKESYIFTYGKKYIASSILSFIASSIFNILWQWIETGYLSCSLYDAYTINELYFVFDILTYYFIFLYFCSIFKHNNYKWINIITPPLTFIPTGILLFFYAINYKTHWMFYITDNNSKLIYHRGSIQLICYLLIPFGYLIFLSLFVLFNYYLFNPYNIRKKLSLNIVPFTTVICFSALFNFITYIIPLYQIIFSLCLLGLYMIELDILTLSDVLTGLNNRRKFGIDIKQAIKERHAHFSNICLVEFSILNGTDEELLIFSDLIQKYLYEKYKYKNNHVYIFDDRNFYVLTVLNIDNLLDYVNNIKNYIDDHIDSPIFYGYSIYREWTSINKLIVDCNEILEENIKWNNTKKINMI